MRSLAKPAVLMRAAYAAAFTMVVSYPRFAIWADRPFPIAFLCVMVFVTSFVLWAFAFAWQPDYAHRPVISLASPARIWALASVYALLSAAVLHFVLDPTMRLITPSDYPADWHAWVAGCLFNLAMDPLFLLFAPYAFFIRLSRRPAWALAGTVLFDIFVQILKMDSTHARPPAWLILELGLFHIVGGLVSVYVYLQGGALPVWWMTLLVQLRLVWSFFQVPAA